MPPRALKRKKRSEPEEAASGEGSDQDQDTAFTAWARDRGVEIRNVKPARLPGRGLGLITTSRIKNGKRILFVPEKAMFKPGHEVEHASPQAQLAVSAMAACKAADSGMSTWEATWPTDLDFEHSMPMRWPTHSRDLLPPPVEQPLRRQEEDYGKDLEAVKHHLTVNGHTEADFRYYWSIVNSRSFHWKPPKGQPGSMVLCPFIDYINHAHSGTTCNVFQRSTGYEVVANRDYGEPTISCLPWRIAKAYADTPQEAGEEILATYGAHSNDKLLVHYGFLCASTPDTPNDDDDIRLDHILLPTFTEEVRNQLQDVGFLGGYALLSATNELCFKTQVAVRAMLLTCNEWEYFVANGEDLAEDHTAAVRHLMQPLLIDYRTDALQKLAVVEKRKGEAASEANELSLLKTRWTQVVEAIYAFLDV